MNIKFLGTGGVFDYKYGNSSLTIDCGARVLIDCGPLVFPRLMELEIINTIDYLLLTHLHGDHTGSLFQLIFFIKNKLQRPLKILYATNNFKTQIEVYLSSQGIPTTHYELHPLSTISVIQAINTTNKHVKGVTSFGYVFEYEHKKIYYSGDLGDITVTNNVINNVNDKELLIFHEIHHIMCEPHVHYSELHAIAAMYHIFGYHCNSELIPADNQIPLVINQPEFMW